MRHRITEQRDTLGRSTGYTYAKNRPTLFTKSDGSVTVECTYDTMGRRATKKVMTNGILTEHRRFLYRGYLQIACCDLTRAYTPALWYILWESLRGLGGGLDKTADGVRRVSLWRRHSPAKLGEGSMGCARSNARSGIAPKGRAGNGVPASHPTQPTATRPLAIQKNGIWYTYGWDLTKNICETYRTDGRIDLAYTYTPYGEVSPAHAYDQPLRWSSEYHDTELGLVYYNYRHYNPAMGRWMGRDFIEYLNLYKFIQNGVIVKSDYLGLKYSHETNFLPIETIYNARKVIAYTGPREIIHKQSNSISTKGYTFRELLELIGTTITHMGYDHGCYISGMEFHMDIVTLIPNDIRYRNSEAREQLIRHEKNRAFVYKEIHDKILTPLSEFHFKKLSTKEETDKYVLGIFQEARKQIESYISNELGFIYGGGISQENESAGWKIGEKSAVSTAKALSNSNNDIVTLKNTAVFVGYLGAMNTPKEAKYLTIQNTNKSS